MVSNQPVVEAVELGVRFPPPGQHTSLKRRLMDLVRRRSAAAPFWALQQVSFTVERGENLGVIGLNGSGKSTLLRTIAGIYQPDQGAMTVRGTVSTVLSLSAGLQQDLSGRENLMLLGALLGLNRAHLRQMLPEVAAFSELGEFLEAPVRTYSSGMAARLGFSLVCHLERELLLLDEILGVGDHRFRHKAEARIRELLTAGRTCVLVSHRLRELSELCDRVMWLDRGRVQALGPADEVIAAYRES